MRKRTAIIPLVLLVFSWLCIGIELQSSHHRGSQEIELCYDAGDYIGFTNITQDDYLTGNNITVAILDTGIYADHSAFTEDGSHSYSDRIIAFYNASVDGLTDPPMDIAWHGTWTASILGGNCSVYQGVASGVKFIIMQVFDWVDEQLISSIPILNKAVDWLIQNKELYNIKIVSMSFGAKPENDNLDEIEALDALAKRLTDNGILVVAAAGNYGSTTTEGTVTAPGSEETVLCVGGVDYDDEMYLNSGRGPTYEGIIKPDVCAPAEFVNGARAGSDPNAYSSHTGTSAAAPFVAGLAALMLEKNNQLTATQLKSIISLTSYRTIEPRIIKDNTQGWGIIQAYAALKALDAPIEITSQTQFTLSLNSSYSVYIEPIILGINYYFFELVQLGSAEAELYLFSSTPDIHGNPILIGHTINGISVFENSNILGVFPTISEQFFLVVKLIHNTGNGTFLIRLGIEVRLGVIFALAGINILAMVYIGKQTLNFKKNKD